MLADGRPPGGAPIPLCSWRAPGARRGRGPAVPQASYPRSLGSNSWRLTGPGGPNPGAQARSTHAVPPRSQETYFRAGRSLHAGQQVSRAQHPTSQPRLRLSPSETPGLVLPTTIPTQRKASLPSPSRLPTPDPPRATPRPPVPLQCRHAFQLGQHQKSGYNDGTPRRSQSDSLLPEQVTLFTLSRPRFGLFHFYLRVHPGKEEKKIQKRSESIEKKNKKKVFFFFSERCPQRRKR